MKTVMICPACRARWPGHTRCPDCGGELTPLQKMAHQARVEHLPQFQDLARQFELGQAEKTAHYIQEEDP